MPINIAFGAKMLMTGSKLMHIVVFYARDSHILAIIVLLFINPQSASHNRSRRHF